MNDFDRKKPKVSIVIPSWFSKDRHAGKYGEHEVLWFGVECLDRLLDVIKDRRDDYEVILIDNGSDVTKEDISHSVRSTKGFAGMMSFNGTEFDHNYLCSRYDPERYWEKCDILVRNRKNLGFAPAVNQGIAMARGEFVCVLNNDILVWPGVFEELMKPFDMPLNPPAGVVMPALIKETGDAREALTVETPNLTQNAHIIGPHAEFGSMWIATRGFLKDVAALHRKDEYLVLDENFKVGMGEDRLLWAEVRMADCETYRTHDTRVFHQGNLTISKIPDRKQYTEANREYLKSKKDEYGIES